MESTVLTRSVGHSLAPALSANVAPETLPSIFPNVRFEPLGEYEAPEPSLAAAIRLDSGLVAVVSWGTLTHELVVELPKRSSVDSFLREVKIPAEAITWSRAASLDERNVAPRPGGAARAKMPRPAPRAAKGTSAPTRKLPKTG